MENLHPIFSQVLKPFSPKPMQTIGIYDDLRAKIKGVSRDGAEFKRYCELVTQHFEGRAVFETMPDTLKLVVADWESEQLCQ